MTLIDEKPADLPSTNALDDIPEDALGPVPAVIQAFGKDLLIMDKPPQPGELIKHYRKCKSLGAKVTTEPYKPEPEPAPPVPDDAQDALIGRDGEIADGLDEFDPEFSHNGPADD